MFNFLSWTEFLLVQDKKKENTIKECKVRFKSQA